jgi:hypothetical protein
MFARRAYVVVSVFTKVLLVWDYQMGSRRLRVFSNGIKQFMCFFHVHGFISADRGFFFFYYFW